MKAKKFIFYAFIFSLIAVVAFYIFRPRPTFKIVENIQKSSSYDKSTLITNYPTVKQELLNDDSTYRVILYTITMDNYINLETFIFCETNEDTNSINKLVDVKIQDDNCKLPHRLYGDVTVTLEDDKHIKITVDGNAYQHVGNLKEKYTHNDNTIKISHRYDTMSTHLSILEFDNTFDINEVKETKKQ